MKNSLKKSLLAFIIVASLPIGGLAQQTPTDTGKTNAVRIEDDTSFGYPVEKADEVIDYIKKKYFDNPNFAKSLNLNLTPSYSDEEFIDIYYDTPTLDLLKRKISLRHRTRKSGQNEKILLQLKLSDDDKLVDTNNDGSRNEIKFDVKKDDQTAGWNKPINLVGKSLREEFTARLKDLNIEATTLRPILRLEQRRRRVSLLRPDGQSFIGFSVDDPKIKKLWAKVSFSQMEIELNEISYTEADKTLRERMQNIRKEMIADLKNQFPYFEKDKKIKYEKAFELLAKKIPLYAFWIKIGVL